MPAGVDDAAKVKASYLAAVAHGTETCPLIVAAKATELLGTMLGGYNVKPLIDLLDDAEVAAIAADALKKTLLMFDYFHDVQEKAEKGNAHAKAVLQSWADAEWFTSRPGGAASASPSPSSRSPARPTPTTSRRRPTPGAAPTSRCTRWRC